MPIFSYPLLQVFICETNLPSSTFKTATEQQSVFQKHWSYSTVKLQKEVLTHMGMYPTKTCLEEQLLSFKGIPEAQVSFWCSTDWQGKSLLWKDPISWLMRKQIKCDILQHGTPREGKQICARSASSKASASRKCQVSPSTNSSLLDYSMVTGLWIK